MNRKVLGVLVSLALAALGSFLVISYVNNAEERAVADAEAVEVLVVSDTIVAGERVADVQSKVRRALVPAKAQALGSVASLDDLDGELVAAVDLIPGEQVVAGRFVAQETLAEELPAFEIPADMLQVTVSLSPERALGGQPEVGGQLVPGALVAVLASFEPFAVQAIEPGSLGESELESLLGGSSGDPLLGGLVDGSLKTPNSTHIIIHKALVTAVQIERLPAPSDREDAVTVGVDLGPTTNLLVTVALPASEIERLIFSAEHGTVWLALATDTSSEDGTLIQTRGSIYE